jgi:AraC-like DNA-binding protein
MVNKPILELSIEKAKQLGNSAFIEEDILLIDQLKDVPIPSEPRRVGVKILALCVKGRAQYTIDTQEQMVKRNDVLIISERHVLDNFMASPDLEGLCIIVSADFFDEIMQNVSNISSMFLFARLHPVVALTQQEADIFKTYFYTIKEKIADKEHHFRRELVRTLMLAMFYDLSNVIYRVQQTNAGRQSRGDAIFTRFIKLVEENFRVERRVGWYAEQLCMSPKYLSETIKQVSRRSPNEWIDSYVTLEARVLLKNTALSIKEIAIELNFPSQSFLGKFFKEHVGMSPSEYRKS